MSAESTVNDIIAKATTYASTAQTAALQYAGDAIRAAQGYSSINPPSLNFSTSALGEPDYPSAPASFDDSFAAPTALSAQPTLVTLYVPTLPDFPSAPTPLDTSALFKHAKPVYDVAPFSESDPDVNTSLTVPTKPTITYPTVPTITALDIGAVPSVTLPTFDAEFGGQDPGALTGVTQSYQDAYSSMLPVMRDFIDSNVRSWITTYQPGYYNILAKLEAKVQTGIEGGTALSDEVEQLIYDRGRRRAEAERIRVDTEITRGMAKRGFVIPPGVMTAGLARSQQATANSLATYAAETAIERAKIELSHVQFCLTLSQALLQAIQGMVIQYASTLATVNGQVVDYAKTLAGVLVDTYNAALRFFEVKMQLYRTQAEVYEIRLKSALASLDEHRLELESAKLKTEIDALMIEAVGKSIAAENNKIEIYKAELQGLATRVELEKSKLEVFREKVQAYTARVQGKEAEFRVYEAAIRGDAGVVSAHAQIVEAYRAEVGAQATVVEAEKAHSDAIAGHNRNLIEQYRVDLSRYEAELSAESKRFGSSVDGHRAVLDAYKADLATQLETFKTKYEKSRLQLAAAQIAFDGYLKAAEVSITAFQERTRILATTTSNSAEVAKGIAASALSAQNTMVELVNETIQS